MLDYNKHRTIMFSIIKDIVHSTSSSDLMFKGGTLCYFLYHLQRFSTDLDFDYIGTANPMQIVKSILQKYWTIKDEYEKQRTYFFLLDYWATDHNIKIEISKKKSPHDRYEIVNFYGMDMRAMERSCLFANKLLALTRRRKNRDLFDIHHFFSQWWTINEDVLQYESWKTVQTFLTELIEQLPKQYTSKTILAEIGDLIDTKQKERMKTRIITDTIWYIQLYLLK
jgi:predicted nucleotidyltransferase component of viral defense system